MEERDGRNARKRRKGDTVGVDRLMDGVAADGYRAETQLQNHTYANTHAHTRTHTQTREMV